MMVTNGGLPISSNNTIRKRNSTPGWLVVVHYVWESSFDGRIFSDWEIINKSTFLKLNIKMYFVVVKKKRK